MELNKVTTEDFEKKVGKAKNLVLVDFFATWCGPCKMLSPVLEEVNDEMSNKINMYKLDIDESLELAKKYGVLSVPTLILFKDGEEVERLVGFRQKDEIIEALENANK